MERPVLARVDWILAANLGTIGGKALRLTGRRDNLVGAFLLGTVVARGASPSAHPLLRPFLVVGVFGSFTTFSALAFDNRLLAAHNGEAVALLHLVGSIAIGIVAFACGAAIARGRR